MKAPESKWKKLYSLFYDHLFVGLFMFPAMLFAILTVFWIKEMHMFNDYTYEATFWEHAFEVSFAFFFVLETLFLSYLGIFTSVNAIKKFRR